MKRYFRLRNYSHPYLPGDYPMVRLFDNHRVLVEVSTPTNSKRQLTLMKLADGEIVGITETII